jgi:ribonuclease D
MTEEAPPELPLLAAPRNSDVLLIESSLALLEAIDTLEKSEGPFALDAERASGFKYFQSAYLIQIHRAGSPIYLVDPQAVMADQGATAFSKLSDLLATDEWVLHAASQDIPCLRELGLNPVTVFDTELGSRLAGLSRVGLGAVTEHFLKIRLAKEHSAVDWSIRPLRADWLNYAALDVDVLLELRSSLLELLEEQGKLHWARQEFETVAAMVPKEPKVDKWRGMSGLHQVKDTRLLAIARDLWLARESLAEKLDVSPGRLIPDSSIVSLALNPVKTKPELASSKSFSGRASRSYLDTWWLALSSALTTRDLPVAKLAATGIPNHRTWVTRFPDADARLKAVRPAIAELAEKLELPVENLLTPDYLRQVCFAPTEPITRDSIAQQLSQTGARKWQIELVAELIANALNDPQSEDSIADESSTEDH